MLGSSGSVLPKFGQQIRDIAIELSRLRPGENGQQQARKPFEHRAQAGIRIARGGGCRGGCFGHGRTVQEMRLPVPLTPAPS
ncbi:hypothetical protein [Serpentinomonas raichei]|uniref:hypothetical protein n=1 Tax=Serpentinimonas barnesii TaxID=1458427 RepID=UPI0011EA6406